MEVFRNGFGGGAGWKDWEGWQAGVERMQRRKEQRQVVIRVVVSEVRRGPEIGSGYLNVLTGEEM